MEKSQQELPLFPSAFVPTFHSVQKHSFPNQRMESNQLPYCHRVMSVRHSDFQVTHLECFSNVATLGVLSLRYGEKLKTKSNNVRCVQLL